ncbi:[Pyruvate dehydrogenase (acetyl-transferring)] kinase 2, mitochondrial, partial [Coemansia sp. RSA 2706]
DEGVAQLRRAPRGFATHRAGVVRADCDVAALVHECAQHAARRCEDEQHLPPPPVRVEGAAALMCIPAHVSYIVHELLRNAMRHVMRRYAARPGPADAPLFPPVRVTVCTGRRDVVVRVSDQGGGIPPDVLPYIWSFTHPLKAQRLRNFHDVLRMDATVDDDAAPALGFGLPMARVYAEYWGGSVTVHSLPGHGVDAYVQLPRLGNAVENIAAHRTH